MLGDIHGIVQAAVGAAMAQHNQENQQLRKENNALAEENNALAERLKSLKVTDGSNKTSKPVGRRTNKSSKQPQSAKVAGNPSVPLKTPDKKKTRAAHQPHRATHQGENKYTKEKKNPGSLGQELDRKAISHARGRLRKARVSFAKNHNLPKRYKRVLADLSAHSDDEYNDQHSCYIIKTVAFRSANANKFFRRLDEEMKKEYEGPRDQRRIRRVPDVPQPSIFKALPKQLPLDFFDPTWFNNSMASRKRKAADVMSAAFLPDADKSLLGTVQAIESMTDEDFNEKYLLKCQKLYDITHAFYISEDEEEDIDNDDGESEVLVLGESRNTSDEDNLDDEDMDYDDANEQVEDQDGGNDERNEDEDHGDEARAQRYQMMVLDDANCSLCHGARGFQPKRIRVFKKDLVQFLKEIDSSIHLPSSISKKGLIQLVEKRLGRGSFCGPCHESNLATAQQQSSSRNHSEHSLYLTSDVGMTSIPAADPQSGKPPSIKPRKSPSIEQVKQTSVITSNLVATSPTPQPSNNTTAASRPIFIDPPRTGSRKVSFIVYPSSLTSDDDYVRAAITRMNVGRQWCYLEPKDPNVEPTISRLQVGREWCYIQQGQAGIISNPKYPNRTTHLPDYHQPHPENIVEIHNELTVPGAFPIQIDSLIYPPSHSFTEVTSATNYLSDRFQDVVLMFCNLSKQIFVLGK
ncbi:hypothetical protein H4Q26_010216 [Puccinia striiformis f. sp. tritici PST-130]|nr:hypothetical protein H4Q26_010216 [Puccinia striiformis f. sp. tritici PST-130]